MALISLTSLIRVLSDFAVFLEFDNGEKVEKLDLLRKVNEQLPRIFRAS